MVIEGGNGPRRKGATAARRRGPRVEQPQTVLRLPEDPYASDHPRRARRSRGVTSIAAITVAVAVIIALASNKSKPTQPGITVGAGSTSGVGGGESAPPAAGTAADTDPADQPVQFKTALFPGTTLNGVMIGYKNTKEGAEAAAANYTAAYGSEPMLNAKSRHTLIATIADPAIASSLQSQLDTAFTAAQHSYGLDAKGNPPTGQTIVYRAVPVGVSVQSYAPGKAVVSVWTDTLDGLAGQGSTNPITETWSTITLTLTWVGNDWKWNGFTQTDGPVPVSGTQRTASPDDLQKAVQQYARLRYAP